MADAMHQGMDHAIRRNAAVKPVPRHAATDALAASIERACTPDGDWPALGSVPVSVLIPVKNESANIVACVRRVLWANEIVVVDSHSTDATVALSQALGADVYQFHFPASGWPKKKNWALENVPWKNEWVLILDADEHMTPELAREIASVVHGTYAPRDSRTLGCGDGFWLNRRFMFMGRWIKGCGYYPSYNIRLFKHAVGRYERIGELGDTQSGDNEVHEHIVLSTGKAGYLENDFLHYAYPDLTTWIEKHNRYSNWEAHAMAAGNKGRLQASPFGAEMERRRWVRQFARHLPFRPTLRFIYTYILKRGFLDGYRGLVMSRLMAWYEFVSIVKFRELRARESNPAETVDVSTAAAERVAMSPKEQAQHQLADAALDPIQDLEPPLDPMAVPLGQPRASVLILTLNEELNIENCLSSCSWCDDIHVLDSGSTDRTVAIAQRLGATTHYHAFKSFGEQRNWAIENIQTRHDWVFHLDADERFTPDLVEAMLRLLSGDPTEAGFFVPNKLMFMGRWLKRTGGYPTYQMRLFHKHRMRFCDYGHGQRESTSGTIGTIDTPYLHYAFNKGLTDWFAKHNRYSTLEALTAIERRSEHISWRKLLARDRVERRRAWKEFSFRVPCRPYLRWLYTMFVVGGAFEGNAGRAYARMLLVYEQMISLKLRMLRADRSAPSWNHHTVRKSRAD